MSSQNLEEILSKTESANLMPDLKHFFEDIIAKKDTKAFDNSCNLLSKSSTSVQHHRELLQHLIPKISSISDKSLRGNFFSSLVPFAEYNHEIFDQIEKKFLEDLNSAKRFAALGKYYSFKKVNRSLNDAQNFEIRLQTAEAFFKAKNLSAASDHLLQSKQFKLDRVSPANLLKRYYNLSADIQISKNDFLTAAHSLYTLSKLNLSADDQKVALERALRISILAPNQSHIVTQLLDDARATSLPAYSLLEGLKRKQVISDVGLERLWNELKNEESVQKSDLENQIRKHNLSQVSHLYSSISFGQLSKILNTNENDLLNVVTQQVRSNLLNAVIDQLAGYIIFTSPLSDFDDDIKEYCSLVESVSRRLK